MATTKTTKKEVLPRIHKKWYDLKIDHKTLRPVEFSWHLSTGTKRIRLFDAPNKPNEDVIRLNLRNKADSYYFVFDKTNKRIFAYPVRMSGHDTRSSCETAHYEKISDNIFYMFDENKQIWEIPRSAYRKYTGYNYQTREYSYTTIEAKPRKINRIGTMNYNIQCQLTSHIRSMFAALYGNEFVYQNTLITDSNIRVNHWIWICWLNTKGRKYSEKTVKTTDELMNKISPESRVMEQFNTADSWSKSVVLESVDGVTVLCYYSHTKETFRQVFNAKTCKLENFIWKNDRWQKSGKLSGWQQIIHLNMDPSYAKNNPYDHQFLSEASEYFKDRPNKSLYDTIMNYLSYPIVHQILQLQDKNGRLKMYDSHCSVSKTYGKIPNKGKTLFAKLGINKYQFDHPQCIVHIKQLLNTNDIAHIDQTTWNMCVNIINMRQFDKYDTSIATFLRKQNKPLINTWCKLYSSYDKLSSEYQRRSYWRTPQEEIKELYRDYFQGLSSLQRRGLNIAKYPIVFNNAELLQRYHDEISISDDLSEYENHPGDQTILDLYHTKQHMLENDGTYCILHPQSAYDVGYEGAYLRHCVGRCYLNSIIQKTTSIYFLRRLEAPNTPWLTVEVCNKQCIQIHGYSNSWMGSSDKYFDAVPFLCWWFEKHDITCPPELLTCRSLSYSSYSSSYRAMPYEKIEAYKQSKKLKKSS